MPVLNNFGGFIDQYILLLVARFNAQLDDTSVCSKSALEPWETVARCVRDVLAHPQTEGERQEVAHVDVALFDAEMCRGRARYVLWQQRNRSDVTSSTGKAPTYGLAKTGKQRGSRKNSSDRVSSTFNITIDSLRNEVEGIYSATRANLPNTFTDRHGGKEFLRYHRSSSVANKGVDSDGDSDLEVVDFTMRSEAEEKRDQVVAQARDALLTKIQAMQAEFFQQHKRWVDVPFDVKLFSGPGNGDSTCGANLADAVENGTSAVFKSATWDALKEVAATGAITTTPNLRKVTMGNEAILKAKTNGESTATAVDDAAPLSVNLLNALKSSVQLKRPLRPSQMQEEDYQAQYNDNTELNTVKDNHDFNEKLVGHQTVSKNFSSLGVPPPPSKGPLRCLPNGSTANGTAIHPGRSNRWSVVEYDVDSGEESDDDKKG